MNSQERAESCSNTFHGAGTAGESSPEVMIVRWKAAGIVPDSSLDSTRFGWVTSAIFTPEKGTIALCYRKFSKDKGKHEEMAALVMKTS